MPWRGPLEDGEYPTLGYDVSEWIEAHCVVPDGHNLGKPLKLTVRYMNQPTPGEELP